MLQELLDYSNWLKTISKYLHSKFYFSNLYLISKEIMAIIFNILVWANYDVALLNYLYYL